MTILEDIKTERLLRVYIEQSPGNGNQANSLNFLRYLLHHGFKGKVQFIYASDEAKKKLEKLLNIVLDQPVKSFTNTDLFSYERAESFEFVNLHYFDTHPTEFENCKYLISGGEPEPRSGELAVALKAGMLVCSPPYTYFPQSVPFIAYQNGSIVEFPEAIGTNPPYFVANESVMMDYLARSSEPKLQNLFTLLQRKNAGIQSVYGLRHYDSLLGIAEAAESTRLELIELGKMAANSSAVILFHYNLSDQTLRQKLSTKFLLLRLDQVDFADLLTDNRTMIVETGGLPFEVFNYLMIRPSFLPPFQEGENSRNLLTHFGRSFVHVSAAHFSSEAHLYEITKRTVGKKNHWLISAPPEIRDALLRVTYFGQKNPEILSHFYLQLANDSAPLAEYFRNLNKTATPRYDILSNASAAIAADLRDPSTADLIRDLRFSVLNFTGNCSAVDTRYEWDERFEKKLNRFGFSLQRCATLFFQTFTALYHCPNITTTNAPRLNAMREKYFLTYPGAPSLENVSAFLAHKEVAAETASTNILRNFIVGAFIVLLSNCVAARSQKQKIAYFVAFSSVVTLCMLSDSAESSFAYAAGSLVGLFSARAFKFCSSTQEPQIFPEKKA